MAPSLRDKLDDLPTRPGVYLYRNAAGSPIYIGKAKSLRSRVRSYFQPGAQHAPHIARMVSEVADLEFIVVGSEMEALILESNLIKRERPRYNVVLRDDKQYPYLKLSQRDPYPRASLVRRARLDGNLYAGPFLPAVEARRSLKLIQRVFQVATCREVFDGKRRPCLYFHLDQCLAPCAGKTTPEEYGRAVDDARMFLEGRGRDLQRSLEQRMRDASDRREYERAARYRDTLRTVRRRAEKQDMVSTAQANQDYLSHYEDAGFISVQLFQVREGKVQGRREFDLGQTVQEVGQLYAAVVAQYYAEVIPPGEICLPHLPDAAPLLERWLSKRAGRRVRLRVPQRGMRRRLLELVTRNAKIAAQSRFRLHDTDSVEGLEGLARLLDLEEPPYRIECFDISNIQGTDTVASMVVWEGGKPRKSEYRTYNIRSVDGADDFASIAEAVTRRYRRLLSEDRRLPDLVLIDGGAGQLGSAVRSLTCIGLPMLPVASIAKREEEIHIQLGAAPIWLERRSPTLRLVQRIRDEAHRFAVTRHRQRRKKRTLKTDLTRIPGIGPVISKRLLRAFGSVEAVRKASREELARVAGPRRAREIVEHYRGSE